MMIHHHPGDDLLLALAAGRLESGPALVLRVHLESCPACRAREHTLQAVGGAMLDAGEPELLAPEALARTLERIDTPPAQPPRERPPQSWPAPTLPNGAPWPRGLSGCDISPWRWMAPGMHFARVAVPYERQGSLYLLKIAPGRSLARHSHTHLEFTQVLCGAFEDGRSTFAAGDFDQADGEVHHRPVVAPGETCVCLAYVEGRLLFDGLLVGAIGRIIGM